MNSREKAVGAGNCDISVTGGKILLLRKKVTEGALARCLDAEMLNENQNGVL